MGVIFNGCLSGEKNRNSLYYVRTMYGIVYCYNTYVYGTWEHNIMMMLLVWSTSTRARTTGTTIIIIILLLLLYYFSTNQFFKSALYRTMHNQKSTTANIYTGISVWWYVYSLNSMHDRTIPWPYRSQCFTQCLIKAYYLNAHFVPTV